MIEPIDLRERYGNSYIIELDQSASFEEGGSRNLWYLQIPCMYGYFYPHSKQRIAFYCKGSMMRSKLHRAHPEIEVRQWSEDGEAVFLFTPDQFDLVAKYAKPRRKRGPRKLKAEHRDKLAKASRDHRFASDSTVDNGSLEDHHATISTHVSHSGTKT